MSRSARGGVVVTGASSGIGKVCALRLSRMGFTVFAGVRKQADGDALRREAVGRIVPLTFDVTDSAALERAAGQVQAQLPGGLAGLVNNAGIAVIGPLEFLPVEELRKQLEVNVVGQIAVAQAFLPMLREGRGRIVNIGSISGRMSVPLLGPYCASKFALEALTAALRMELYPSGIKVSMIEPAGIETPIWGRSLARAERTARRFPPEAEQFYGKMLAQQRARAERNDRKGIPPEAVARCVAHALVSDKPRTRYIIGRRAWVWELLRLVPETLREHLIVSRLWG